MNCWFILIRENPKITSCYFWNCSTLRTGRSLTVLATLFPARNFMEVSWTGEIPRGEFSLTTRVTPNLKTDIELYNR